MTELTDYQRLVEKPHLARLHAQLAECHAALAKLQAERDEAREALRPFAEAWDDCCTEEQHGGKLHEIPPIISVTYGHFRAASRALGGGE